MEGQAAEVRQQQGIGSVPSSGGEVGTLPLPRAKRFERPVKPQSLHVRGGQLLAAPSVSKNRLPAHEAPVVGIFPSSFNSRVTSVDVEGQLRSWDFRKLSELMSKRLPGRVGVVTGRAFGAGGLVAAAAVDGRHVWVVDEEKLAVVREFKGHVGGITALEFSPDGRWLLSAGLDAMLRVWDLPTGKLY